MRRIRQPHWFVGGETIIDVGSHVGTDLIAVLQQAPTNVSVHTFEPIASLRDKLIQNVRTHVRSGLERLHIHPYGLGGSNRSSCFATGDAHAALGVHETKDAGPSSCAMPAEIREIGSIVGIGFPRVDFMQINCEGCEYEIIESLLGSPFLNRIEVLEVQFHLELPVQNDTHRYCRIEAGLRSAGYGLEYRCVAARMKLGPPSTHQDPPSLSSIVSPPYLNPESIPDGQAPFCVGALVQGSGP
jgi:FkbM family methyltransferase